MRCRSGQLEPLRPWRRNTFSYCAAAPDVPWEAADLPWKSVVARKTFASRVNDFKADCAKCVAEKEEEERFLKDCADTFSFGIFVGKSCVFTSSKCKEYIKSGKGNACIASACECPFYDRELNMCCLGKPSEFRHQMNCLASTTVPQCVASNIDKIDSPSKIDTMHIVQRLIRKRITTEVLTKLNLNELFGRAPVSYDNVDVDSRPGGNGYLQYSQ